MATGLSPAREAGTARAGRPAAAAEQDASAAPFAGEGPGLGTLSWQRIAKVAGLAVAVAVLAASSVVASHLVRVVGPAPVHGGQVVITQRAAAPASRP